MDATTEEKTYRDWQRETLTEIKDQTKITNGRVSKLEQFQSYIIGFCAAVSILMLPMVFIILKEQLGR